MKLWRRFQSYLRNILKHFKTNLNLEHSSIPIFQCHAQYTEVYLFKFLASFEVETYACDTY